MSDLFLNKVVETIGKFDMFHKGERLLVCLSGGADSVSLLLCLKKLGYDVCACHVNHQLRGEESERDQRFCQQLCEKLGVELFTQRIDVTEYCKQNSVSVEEGARELRYRVFSSIKADKICTAHTLSDCIETTVFNLARGTGLKGLCSIPPKRDNIVRPLINCTREEIISFLGSEGQNYVTDSTNLSDEYTRNRIRHNVVPQLEKINPSLLKSYSNTLQYLRSDLRFLEKCAEKAFEQCCDDNVIDVSVFRAFDECIKDRILMKWLQDNGISVSHDKIPLIFDIVENSGKLNIADKTFIVCKNGKLYPQVEDETVRTDNTPVLVSGNGEYQYAGRKVVVRTMNMEEINCEYSNVHKMFANCCLDYDKIIGGLVLRSRDEGDRIRLVNRTETYSIRKLLKNAYPLKKRSSVIVMYDDEGAVFVEGYGVSERVKITEDTKRLLTLEIANII